MVLLDVYDSLGNKTGRVVERGNKDEKFNKGFSTFTECSENSNIAM